MKRKILFILLAAVLTVSAFAQGWGNRPRQPQMPHHAPRQMMPRQPVPGNNRNFPQAATETVTVSGALSIAYGRPALESGEVTYIIAGLNRLAGFVDGLKEGAQITIEGAAISMQKESQIKFLRPVKLTLNGKTYDMALPRNELQNFIPPRSRQPYNRGQHWNFL